MTRKIKYNGWIGLRADDKTREILMKFKKRTGMGFSKMIRSVFLYFDISLSSITKKCLAELQKNLDVIYEPWRETGIIYFDSKELAEKLEGIDIFINNSHTSLKSLKMLVDMTLMCILTLSIEQYVHY